MPGFSKDGSYQTKEPARATVDAIAPSEHGYCKSPRQKYHNSLEAMD
jgi:hypothetical protein